MNIKKVEIKAIEQNDSNYFLHKGAILYNKGEYLKAIEYYEIASAMGNSHAISNLGYCYLYGRGIQKDEQKALLYFSIAASKNDVDALYKLGTFYLSGICVDKDNEVALYLLNKAADYAHNLLEYPSLCYTLATEYLKDIENNSVDNIYYLLETAKSGYEYEIEVNGASYYEKYYKEVLKTMENPIFDEIKYDEEIEN